MLEVKPWVSGRNGHQEAHWNNTEGIQVECRSDCSAKAPKAAQNT